MTSLDIRNRRRRAEIAIDAYVRHEEALIDLLADLMHWTDAASIDFERCCSTARLHHIAEAGGAS